MNPFLSAVPQISRARYNLAKLALHVAPSGWETQNARGANRRPQPAGQVAVKREPSSLGS